MDTDVQPQVAAMAEAERQSLIKMEGLLRKRKPLSARVTMGAEGEQIEVPEPAVRLIHEMVARLVRGDEVSIVSPPDMLTTQQAADLLHISRTYLVTLLERGRIPFVKVGTHRRVRYTDLVTFRKAFDAKRRQALNDLTELSQELGLYSE